MAYIAVKIHKLKLQDKALVRELLDTLRMIHEQQIRIQKLLKTTVQKACCKGQTSQTFILGRETVLRKVHRDITYLSSQLEENWDGSYYIRDKGPGRIYIKIADCKTHKTSKASDTARNFKPNCDQVDYRPHLVC